MVDTEVKVKVGAENKTDQPLSDAERRFKEFAEQAKATGEAMDKAFKLPENSLADLNSKMDSWVNTLRAATPQNEKYAQAMMEITTAYKRGEVGAKEAADSIEKLQKEMKEGERAGVSFGDKIKGIGSALNETVQSVTGLSLAEFTLTGALVGGVNMMKDAVEQYSSYVEAVDKMSMVTGIACEDLSRLIQVADDFKVEQSALETAMRMALQNGFNPTIENIAQLSDRFLSIQDPTQRAAEMQKIFGKSWEDMIPLLIRGGQEIRNAAAGVSENMIVTEYAIEKNRQLQKSQDDLADSWTGVKNAFAANVLPELAGSLAIFAENIQDLSDGKNVFQVLGENQKKYAELDEKLTRDKQARTYDWNDAEREKLKAANAATAAIVESTAANKNAITMIGNYTSAEMARGYAQQALIANLASAKQQMAEYEETTKSLNAAYGGLTEAQNRFNESFGDKIVTALDQADLKGKDYEKALGLIDEKLGTTHLAQKKANDELKSAIDQYKKTGDINAFSQALDGNKSKWQELDSSMQNAQTKFESVRNTWLGLVRDIKAANGTHVTITADVNTGGGGGDNTPGQVGGTHGGDVDLNGPGGATGLDFIVPAGYMNDSYSVRAQSFEHVKISPPGTEETDSKVYMPITIIVNGAQDPAAVADEVDRKLAQKSRMRAGFQYAGK